MRTSLRLGIGLVCVVLAMIPLAYKVRAAREAARRSQCACNFCGIKIALHNYHETYGSFPPAYVADAAGKPMHSWRVLLLPYLEQSTLYEAYNFAEPWDGPNNVKLLDRMPRNLACPSHTQSPTRFTNYVLITGPGTAFPGAGTTKIDDITDGTANTLFAAETVTLEIPWTAPIDLDVRSMSFRLNDPKRPSISSDHPGGANTVFVGGDYRFLRDSLVADDLRALITISGGERVVPDPNAADQPIYHDAPK